MTVFDGVILCWLFVGLWRGFRLGAVKTAIVLAGWFVALIFASKFAPILALFLQPFIDNRVAQITVAFFVIALVVVVIARLIGWLIAKTLNVLKLSPLDRLFGAMLGAFVSLTKILMLLNVASFMLVHLPSAKNSVMIEALLPFAPIAKTVVAHAFDEVWQEVENPYNDL